MFLVDADNPGFVVGDHMRTIDASTVGGHCRVTLSDCFVPDSAVLGEAGRGFAYAQVRLVPARLTHCMRWLGAARRAADIAAQRAVGRELFARPPMQINAANLLSLLYVALFPSTLAYLCFNRGIQLIGANRAAPFFHVVPVFGTVMSIVFLGEHPQLFHFLGFALVLTGVFVASRATS